MLGLLSFGDKVAWYQNSSLQLKGQKTRQKHWIRNVKAFALKLCRGHTIATKYGQYYVVICVILMLGVGEKIDSCECLDFLLAQYL